MITTFAWFGYELPKKSIFDLIKQAGFDGASCGGLMILVMMIFASIRHWHGTQGYMLKTYIRHLSKSITFGLIIWTGTHCWTIFCV